MAQNNFASDYNDVNSRLIEFRDKYPEGSLQPANIAKPFEVLAIEGQTYIVYAAAAYRTPDDPRPGIGLAYELVPGRTPYTKNSELQNAETSAWGRAIVAALASDTKKGIASAEEVRNRQAERDHQPAPDPVREAKARVWAAAKKFGWDADDLAADFAREHGGGVIGDARVEELTTYAMKLELTIADTP